MSTTDLPALLLDFMRQNFDYESMAMVDLHVVLYRDEFTDDHYRRLESIRKSRPEGYVVIADCVPYTSDAVYLGAEGGSSWNCSSRGHDDFGPTTCTLNHCCKGCSDEPPLGKNVSFHRQADEATVAWVEEWEKAHGSRFRSTRGMLDELSKHFQTERTFKEVFALAMLKERLERLRRQWRVACVESGT